MYAVIFKAKVNEFDKAYDEMAARMRELAISEYGCSGFVSVNDADQEITISYWDNLNDIRKWKQNAEHLVAQELGKSSWYKSYHVQVVEIVREYKKDL
jgi:heme-degrading monooxygenase HmoA